MRESPAALARSELIVGGQKSGKSHRAEYLARQWLAQSSDHRVVFIVTARADADADDEMDARIARHRSDRAQRLPEARVVEEPLELSGAIREHGEAKRLVVVDCLTLWLTNLVWPDHTVPSLEAPALRDAAPAIAALLGALDHAPGPCVLVSNEIGMGVIPMGRPVRAFCDALGLLNQQVAERCERVTLMAAGLPLSLKGGL